MTDAADRPLMATILLVEDTPANRALATKLLHAAGHEVLSAETAAAGIRLARERAPDLVLMDLGLPGMSGWHAIDRDPLRPADRRSPRRRVHGARDGGRSRTRACAGFDGYLSKPIDFATFADSVADFLP